MISNIVDSKRERICGDTYVLTKQEIKEFHENGYVKLEGVVTENELKGLWHLYDQLVFMDYPRVPKTEEMLQEDDDEKQGMHRINDDDLGISHPHKQLLTTFDKDYGDHSSPVGTPKKKWKMINVTLPSVHYPPFRNNMFHKRASSIAKQLYCTGLSTDSSTFDSNFSDDEIQWDYDQLLTKLPNRTNAKFPMHQDNGYWYIPKGVPTVTATCSLALNDADEENGCLVVIPGTHKKEKCFKHKDSVKSNSDDKNDYLLELNLEEEIAENAGEHEIRPISIPVNAGDCTVHNEWIVHGSGGNSSKDRFRHTYVTAFRHRDMIAYERSMGFRHSYNDLEALNLLRRTKLDETI